MTAATVLNHVMIDIETLGVEVNSLVLSIGITLFNPDTGEIGEGQQWLPDLESQNGTINLETLTWWQSQPGLLMGYLRRYPTLGPSKSWEDISTDLKTLLSDNKVSTLWCNGLDFDFPILASVCARTAVPDPFSGYSYSERRCLRQWKLAAEHNGWVPSSRPKSLQAHDAKADAVWQAQEACSAWAYLSK